MKKREKCLVYCRVFWVILLTGVLCNGFIAGNLVLQIAEFSKWALITTYFTFVYSLFSISPIMEKELMEYHVNKNKLFRSWKFFTVLF